MVKEAAKMLHDIGKSKTVGPVPFADEDYKRRGNETASSAFSSPE